MTPTLTILGLYNYDNTLFDGFRLPGSVDRDTLIDNLLGELFECEVLYPDVDIMKNMISRWSMTMVEEWRSLARNLSAEYDATGMTDTYIESRDLRSTGTGSSFGSTDRKVAGFNNLNTDNTLVPSESDNSTLTSSTNNTDRGTIERTHSIKGAVNGKSSAQLLEEEIKLRAKYDIYSIIINDFKQRFCLMVY